MHTSSFNIIRFEFQPFRIEFISNNEYSKIKTGSDDLTCFDYELRTEIESMIYS